MVEHSDSVDGQKPRRRWFRLRFGLRTLLLLTTAVAVWLSFELRRAEHQEELVARVEAMGGSCQRLPREWIPQFMHGLLDENQGYYVDAITLQAIQAPSRGRFAMPLGPSMFEELHAPDDIEEFLRLPGMDEVRNLNLSGTSFADEMLDELAALDDLKAVTFTVTAVTEEGIERFKASRPDCVVTYAAIGNGSSQLVFFHRQALSVTRDLALFAHAQRGEAEAIKGLLAACNHDEENYDIEKVQAKVVNVLEKFRGSLPEGKSLSPKGLYNLLEEKVALGDLSAFETLEAIKYRSRFQPSRFLLDFLRHRDSDSMRAPLADTIRNGGPEARFLAVKLLGEIGDLALLEEALGDAAGEIRLEAVLGLSGIGGPEAARCLADACDDLDPKVRETAVRELATVATRKHVPVLLEAAADHNSEVRWQAVHALERYLDPRAVEPLIAALDDKSSLVRCAAARTLGKIGDPRAVPSLEAATGDEDKFVRDAAEVALEKMGTESKE